MFALNLISTEAQIIGYFAGIKRATTRDCPYITRWFVGAILYGCLLLNIDFP